MSSEEERLASPPQAANDNVVQLFSKSHIWVRKPNGERVRVPVEGMLPTEETKT